MVRQLKQPSRPRLAVEDALVCILGLATGPLLWWMSSMWQQMPAASSVQTLEYWIASICGFVGLALCVLWSLYGIAALGLVLGLKTRNAMLTYWSEVLTPRFLRRLIVSVLGAQVALTSQAFAAPTEHQSAESHGVQQHEPFMPYVHEPSENSTATSQATPGSRAPTPQPTISPSQSTPTASPDPVTPRPSPTVESRHESRVDVTPEPPSATTTARDIEPSPRQTSTFDLVPDESAGGYGSAPSHESHRSFVPQQPVPAPHIAAPNESRGADEPTVIVKSGDCLWDIAVHELGVDASLFEIDRRWREWWEYNQESIGDDPHILRPGTVLVSPPFSK